MGNRYQLTRQIRIKKLISEAIHRVDEDLRKEDIETPGLKVKVADLAKINPSDLQKVTSKTDVDVVAEDQDTSLMDDADGIDTTKTYLEEPEVETDMVDSPEVSGAEDEMKSDQEQASFNLSAWAKQLGKDLGEGVKISNNALKYTYQEDSQPISILVLSNGVIKASGHLIRNFNDFKRLVTFHSQN